MLTKQQFAFVVVALSVVIVITISLLIGLLILSLGLLYLCRYGYRRVVPNHVIAYKALLNLSPLGYYIVCYGTVQFYVTSVRPNSIMLCDDNYAIMAFNINDK